MPMARFHPKVPLRWNSRSALPFAMMLMASSAFAHDTEEAFGEKVRAYLLNHPEVVLEAMDILGSRQEELATAEKLRPHLGLLFGTEMDLRLGEPNAPKVIIEFFDYNCAACRANMPVLRDFVAANSDVAIVKKHLPILSPSSERAARFVLAARKVFGDAAYQALHKVIFSKQSVLSMARLSELAQGLGYDAQDIQSQMQHPNISQIIETHRDLAISINIVGTPTFLTDRAIVEGNVTMEILSAMSGGN